VTLYNFLKALAAVFLFFVVDLFVNAAAYLGILLVNRNAVGVSAWIVLFFARGCASFAGVRSGIAANDKVFTSYPRRGVATVLFIFFGLLSVFFLLDIFDPDLDQAWTETMKGLVNLVGMIIAILTVWAFLWSKPKISN
jgi:hypothetical protein